MAVGKSKTYEVTKEGRIVIYPSIHEVKEKGKLKQILKKLIHIKKGHWTEKERALENRNLYIVTLIVM